MIFEKRGKGRRRSGQVLVEMMLILPFFFLIIFGVMEIGNIAFQTIVAHHAAYEAVRVGSLVAACGPEEAQTCSVNEGKAEVAGREVLCNGDPSFFNGCANVEEWSVEAVDNAPVDQQAGGLPRIWHRLADAEEDSGA